MVGQKLQYQRKGDIYTNTRCDEQGLAGSGIFSAWILGTGFCIISGALFFLLEILKYPRIRFLKIPG